ncbi:DNA-3-methyladenine glycosylase family protein [Haloarchaeobius iranensis]|uniref:DNA-(apurinic or apyrimidinic site) lyase n=1 Tax=Haloarchaeobius iranensis TaxID=996166 RepID=A0A1G9UHM1_9EURY|nr:DNA glycosylase [Haloarchaeobius iranensis]SDM59432.1 N-glycosylase/DNA lyase [Haloarchaeobius iranensis]
METGSIPLSSLPGGFDAHATLESGQSYLWRREDGRMYEGDEDGSPWYYIALDLDRRDAATVPLPDGGPHAIRFRVAADSLEWEATCEAHDALVHLLRLDDDLDAIVADAPDESLIDEAYDAYRGLRLVRDPPFGCTVSFICSAQMRVERIHEMVSTLAREYGEPVTLDGRTYHAFPTPDRLAATTEDELRDLGLGYRAPYVQRTAEMVATDEAHPAAAAGLAYEDAREYLTRFVGVGEKVADCILLFSLGYDEAIPLDTWMRTVVSDYYPDCDRGNYAETSRALRERFGGRYAGYVQTYVFHLLRTRE